MKNILEKISWKTRRLNLKFSFLNIYLRDKNESCGFNFFMIQYNFKTYSALAFMFRLPNKTTVNRLVVDNWDFLFIERFLYNEWKILNGKIMWVGLFGFEMFKYKLLNKIYK